MSVPSAFLAPDSPRPCPSSRDPSAWGSGPGPVASVVGFPRVRTDVLRAGAVGQLVVARQSPTPVVRLVRLEAPPIVRVLVTLATDHGP